MRNLLLLLFGICFTYLQAQQVPDTSNFFSIPLPKYPLKNGPVIQIDAAHHNFHTLEGRYSTFGRILATDGYQMKSSDEIITDEVLRRGEIFVISNPLHQSNIGNWRLPNPSAFTKSEIAAMKKWVKKGGSLFLIADHMPFGGAAHDLAKAFGVEYLNAFAQNKTNVLPDIFSLENGLLLKNEVISEAINSVATFTGSAFDLSADKAIPILKLDDDFTVLMPEIAWQFDDKTKQRSGEGLYQLAAMKYGKGRLIFSGEAAMFSAQLAGPDKRKMGLNNPKAKGNIQLLLDLIHWLDQKN